MNKNDLQELRALLKEELEPIKADIQEMKADIKRIDEKTDMLEAFSNIIDKETSNIRADIKILQMK